MADTTHIFDDACEVRDESLMVRDTVVDPEDDPILFDQYGDQPLLEFSTDDTDPWLSLEEVVKLRNYLNSWILHNQHKETP